MTDSNSRGVQEITSTAHERQVGAYSAPTLQRILSALHQDGLVVLKGVVDTAHIDSLNKAMCEEAERIVADPNKAYNHNIKSNFLQRPPVDQDAYLHEDIYFNKLLLQVANAYLGHKPIWNWLTSNTALANTKGIRQPVHKDSTFEHPLYPYYFIANIPLCDFNVQNGATEFWPGSHATTDVSEQTIATEDGPLYKRDTVTCFIADEPLETRRAVRPPLQPVVKRGDIMVRDIRLWHAGMPNESSDHRIMLGLGYQSPTHPNYTMRLHLPMSQRAFFLGLGTEQVEARANFYPDKEFADINADEHFSLET